MLSNLESPSDNSYKNLNENEIYAIIFPQTFDPIEMKDDLDEKNLDYLYCLNKQKSSKNNKSVAKKYSQEKTEDESSILDDFELFYNKFADIKDEDRLIEDNNDINNQNFSYGFNYERKLIYSYEEDEKIIIVEIDNQKIKDDKIINVEIEIKKNNDEKIINVEKDNQKIKDDKNNINFKNKKDSSKVKETENQKRLFTTNILSKSNNFIQKRIRRRRKKIKHQIDINDKYFPFNKGRGLIYASNTREEILSQEIQNSKNSSDLETQKINSQKENNEKKRINKNYEENNEEKHEDKLDDEFSNYNEQTNNTPDNFLYKFTTKKYFVDENGKKRKERKKRKFKSDDIRKKIKSRFHKTIKNIINDNLKEAGSKRLFTFFPQCFIGNVSKSLNSNLLELTYKELILTNFVELMKESYSKRKIDLGKYVGNIKVLDYLEKNPDISKKSGFDLIKDIKYKDILKLYFTSSQFENSLIQLKNEKESPEYIQEYIKKAKNYVSFYSNEKGCKVKKVIDINEEEDENISNSY